MGVRRHGGRGFGGQLPAASGDEQLDTEPPFQLGDALRERRRRDAECRRRLGPGGVPVDRRQVGELLDGEVGEVVIVQRC
jgi:hypothetical protein